MATLSTINEPGRKLARNRHNRQWVISTYRIFWRVSGSRYFDAVTCALLGFRFHCAEKLFDQQ